MIICIALFWTATYSEPLDLNAEARDPDIRSEL